MRLLGIFIFFTSLMIVAGCGKQNDESNKKKLDGTYACGCESDCDQFKTLNSTITITKSIEDSVFFINISKIQLFEFPELEGIQIECQENDNEWEYQGCFKIERQEFCSYSFEGEGMMKKDEIEDLHIPLGSFEMHLVLELKLNNARTICELTFKGE